MPIEASRSPSRPTVDATAATRLDRLPVSGWATIPLGSGPDGTLCGCAFRSQGWARPALENHSQALGDEGRAYLAKRPGTAPTPTSTAFGTVTERVRLAKGNSVRPEAA